MAVTAPTPHVRPKSFVQPARSVRKTGLLHYGLLLLALMEAFAVDKYQVIPQLQTISIIALFLLWIACFLLPRRDSKDQWAMILLPAALLYFAIASSYLFYTRTGANMIFAISNSRFFFYWLLAPCTILMVKNGARPRDLLICLAVAAAITLVIFTWRQYTWDPHTLLNSPDPKIRALVRTDDIRGARLFYAQYLFYALLCFGFSMVTVGRYYNLFFLIAFAGFLWVYHIVYSRLALAWMPVGLLCAMVLSAKIDLEMRLVGIMLIFLGMLLVVYAELGHLIDYIQDDRGSGAIRLHTIATIMRQFNDASVVAFGYGAESTKIGYTDMLGSSFFPSDTGLLGILFSYGIIGLLAVVIAHVKVIQSAMAARVAAVTRIERATAFAALWCALLFALASGTFYVYMQGDSIVFGALIVALPTILKVAHAEQR